MWGGLAEGSVAFGLCPYVFGLMSLCLSADILLSVSWFFYAYQQMSLCLSVENALCFGR